MNYFAHSDDVYQWLGNFINLERGMGGRPGEHFKLDRMRRFARLAGHPEKSAPVIHVAGSKGKGSVTAMLAAILEKAGMKTARYLSPHVSSWRERIGSAAGAFPEEIYTAAGNELREIYTAFRNGAEDPAERGGAEEGEPTFFELATLYFFLCARAAGAEIMAVETGLGGRLDATNIVDPLASVITLIETEHTEYLGNTPKEIAGEKAGIIKRGRPLFLAEQTAEVFSLFRTKAAALGARLYYLGEHVETSGLAVRREGAAFSLLFHTGGLCGERVECRVPVPGKVYAANAALAALTLTTLFPRRVNADSVRAGLESCALPARFETLAEAPPVITDGAHTAASVSSCADTFCGLYGEGGILLFGCARDKNASALAALLRGRFSRVIITAPGNFRAGDPPAVYKAFTRAEDLRPGRGGPDAVELIPDTAEAIRRVIELRALTRLPVLGTGSFYLAAALRDALPPAEDRT
ncbi:MAG: tetrahydrofolate synthase [Treponema sp.]|jgi:dihydrofolate synthase/folylpolyglutamate synthase|nr:tetrahydrofolate synthase [Treponema sp.]